MSRDAGLFSNATEPGPGGDVNVDARHIDLSGGSISASSLGNALADAVDTVTAGSSSIAIRSLMADRGNIKDDMASGAVLAAREGLPPETGGMLASPLGISLAELGTALDDGYVAQPSLQLAGLWAGSSCTR